MSTPDAQTLVERLRKNSGPVYASSLWPLCNEAATEIERLQREVHNLNWALSTPGYEQMATPEDQAEHEAGQARVTAVLDRMAAAKAEHDAMQADAARYRWLARDDERIGERLRNTLDTWDGCDGKAGFDSAIDAAMRDAPNVEAQPRAEAAGRSESAGAPS